MEHLISKYLFVLFILLSNVLCQAQQISIKSLYESSSDLSARTYPRNDLNGNRCALIKITGNADLLSVSGNSIGNIEKRGNENWVYIVPGTKQILLNIKNASPKKILFNEYGVLIESGKTYELSFEYIDEITTVRTSGLMLLFKPDWTEMNSNQKAMLKTLVKTVQDNLLGDATQIAIRSYMWKYTQTYSYAFKTAQQRANNIHALLSSCGIDSSSITIMIDENGVPEDTQNAIVSVEIINDIQ